MEKVRVTREQADAIHQWRVGSSRSDSELVTKHLINGWVLGTDRCLKDLSADEFIKALYIGYEVEPEFKKGDFVVWHGLVVNIQHPQTNDHKDDGSCYFTLERSDGSTYGNITRDEFRHATPEEIKQEKERRFWSKHGRGVWELRKGDILHKGKYSFTVKSVDEDGVLVEETGFLKTRDELKGSYKVSCFSENRLDVE